MGISANQARLMTLTARQHDLELRAQQISATKMTISLESQQYATAYSQALNDYSLLKNGDKTSVTYNGTTYTDAEALLTAAKGAYDTATTNLSGKEKMWDMELTQVNTEHSAVKTEYDAIKSLIGDNVDKSFNVFG